MYRYLLRLDQRERTLTDRFSWSILFVSDYSPVCSDFLSKYCLDLCARTADRVRFVFFSGVPTSDFDEIVERLRHSDRPSNGILGGVLRKLRFPSQQPRLDFEYEPWSDLRPAALIPFTDISDIQKHLSFECTSKTAMPGSAEGLRFAQRLGIGRHVPCILVLTDIGDLTVHALPFHGRSGDEVYRHVRGWIDLYYELNRGTLDTWASVETRIRDLAANAARSLSAVRNWPSQCRRDLHGLRWMAELTQMLSEDQDVAAAQLPALTPEDLPQELFSTFSGFLHQFAEFDRKSAASRSLIRLADDLAEHVNVSDIRRALWKLTNKPPEYLIPSARTIVLKAWSALSQPGRSAHLLWPSAYLDWWQENAALIFSKKQFFARRSAWHAIAYAGRRDTESIAEHKQRDYAAFWTAAGAQPVLRRPGAAADEILSRLAEHYKVSPSSDEWVSATSDFRTFLADVFSWLQETAPECLSRSSTPLLIRDGISPGGQKPPSLKHLLKGDGRSHWTVPPPTRSGICDARTAAHRQRDRACQALREEAHRLSMADSERRSALAALVTFLQVARADLERQALAQAPAGKVRLADAAEVASIAELGMLLDEYHQAVERIVYPHLRDPESYAKPRLLLAADRYPELCRKLATHRTR